VTDKDLPVFMGEVPTAQMRNAFPKLLNMYERYPFVRTHL
jgi:hypothetical protein